MSLLALRALATADISLGPTRLRQTRLDDRELQLWAVRAARIDGDLDSHLVKGLEDARRGAQHILLAVVLKGRSLSGAADVDDALDAVAGHQDHHAILPDLYDMAVLDRLFVAEEDERVQRDRSAARVLRESMALVEVVSQLAHRIDVQGALRYWFPADDGREEPVADLVRVTADRGGEVRVGGE